MTLPRFSNDPPPDGFESLPAPGVQYRMNVATASAAPWVNANGWRIQRGKAAGYFYDTPSALAVAEAFVYGANAIIHGDEQAAAVVLAFLKRIDAPPLPTLANIGVIDNGSPATGEVLNLLARRNLLFTIVSAPNPKLDLNIHPEAASAADPNLFAQKVRQQLTDPKRLLRIYGSDVVLARLTGDGKRARLHLLNYDSQRSVYGVRVRVRGAWSKITSQPGSFLDYRRERHATEFTLPQIDTYSVVDLAK